MNTIVEHINSAGFSFVEFALPMLIQSCVLIVILLLLDLLLRKKVKAVFRYWIWMLVLVKLVLPTSLSSPLSLGYLFGEKLTYHELAETTSALELAEPVPAETSPGINPIYVQPNPYIPPSVSVTPAVEPVIAETVSPPPAPVTPLSWQGVVFLIWLAVVVAMGLLLLQRALFVRGLVAQAKEAPRLMNDALEYCRASMKIKCRIGLKVSPNATTPSVCGLIRPVILVPWNLASTLGASRLRTVLMHELAHIRRGDLWVNLAQTILQIIYFYNPLLWLANCVIRRIREQAVDEAVLVAMGAKAQQYPQTLVDVAKMAFKRPALSLRLIGVVESKSALAGRIKHILGRPMPKSARLGLISILAIIIAGAVLLPMAKAKNEDRFSDKDLLIKFAELPEGEAKKVSVDDTTIWSKSYEVEFAPGEDLLVVVEMYQAGQPMRIIGRNIFEGSEKPGKFTVTFDRAYQDDAKRSVTHNIQFKLGDQVFNIPVHTPRYLSTQWWDWYRGEGLPRPEERHTKTRYAGIETLFYYGAANLSMESEYKARFWIPGRDVTPVMNQYAIALKMMPLSSLKYLYAEPIGGYQGLDGRIISMSLTLEEADRIADEYKQMIIDSVEKQSTAEKQAEPETSVEDASLDHFVGRYAIAKHPDEPAFEITKKGDVFIFSDLGGPKFEMEILIKGLEGRKFEMEKGRDNLKFGDDRRDRFCVRYKAAEDRYILDSLGMRGEVQDAVISPLTELIRISAKKPGDIFAATLPNGVTVELVGLSEHPSEGKQWWRPDGDLLATRPYERLSRIERETGYTLYEMVYRVRGGEELTTKIVMNDAIRGITGPFAVRDHALGQVVSDSDHLYYGIVSVKKNLDDVGIDILVGSESEWQTDTSLDGPELGNTSVNGPSAMIMRPLEKDGRTYAHVSHSVMDKEFRLIAFDKNGNKSIPNISSSTSKDKGMGTIQAEFKLPLEQVKSIEFQTQKFRRVTFVNASLRPGVKTDVQVGIESEKISGVVGVQDSTLGKSTSAEAAFIIQKVLDRYASIKTYSAIGELLTDVDRPLQAIPGITTEMLQQMGEQQLKSIFTIKMARPNLYCIEWSENIDTDLSKVGNAWSVGDGSYGLIHGKEKSFEKTLRALIWTANNMGRVQSSLFFDTSLNTLRELRNLSQQEDKQLEGVDCYVISGSRNRTTYTYWVSKKDFLIRRYKFVSGGDGKPIEGGGHELTDETIKESLKAMDKAATPEEIAKMRTMLTAANAMVSKVKVTNTETYRNIILDQPISKEQFVPSKDIDEITEELKNLRAQYIHRLKNISPTDPNLKTDVQVGIESDSTVQAVPLKAFEFKLVEKLLDLVKQVEKEYPEQATHWPAGAGLYHIDAQGRVTVWHYRSLWQRSTDCAPDEVGWGSSQLVNAVGMYYLPDGTPLQSRWRERGGGMKDIRIQVGREVGENERVPVIHRHGLPGGHDLLSRDGLERNILLDSWKDLPLAIIVRVDRPMRLEGWWLGDVKTDRQHFSEYDQLIVNGPPGSNNKPMLITVGLQETDVQVEVGGPNKEDAVSNPPQPELLSAAPPIFAYDVKLNFADPTIRDGTFHSKQSIAFSLSFNNIEIPEADKILMGHLLIGQTTWPVHLEDNGIIINEGVAGQKVLSLTWPAGEPKFEKVIKIPVKYGQKDYSCPVRVQLDRRDKEAPMGSYWFCAYLSGRLPWGAGGRGFEIVNLDQQMEFRLTGDGSDPRDAVLGIDIDGDGRINPAKTGGEQFDLYEPFQIGPKTYRLTEVDPYLPRVVFREVASLMLPDPPAKTDVPVEGARAKKTASQQLSFGPVTERVLSFNFLKDSAHLDLDTGRYGKEQPGKDLVAAAGESDGDVRAGLDMVAIPVEARRWESSPQEVLDEVAKSKRHRQARLGGPESRRTFFFKTREDGVGVLQILPLQDSSGQVKVRYKLVKMEPDKKTDVPVESEQGDESTELKVTKSTDQEPVKDRGGISGIVVHSITGEPIADAYVGVGDFGDSGGSNYSRHREQGFHDKTKTDEKGRFELEGLAFTDDHPYLKSHPLVVTHPDFVRHDEKIELLSGGPAPDVKVSLRPAAKIDVTIVDADGNPLEGQWLLRLEALDGRRFIPPGSDPHLSSFASSIWARMPDLRANRGASQGFTFTELDSGEYSIEALKFQLVDNPTPQNIWKPVITYHGSIPNLKIEAGRTKQVRIKPVDYQTNVSINMPEDTIKKPQIPPFVLISRNTGLLLWNDGKAHGPEDHRLGRLQKNALYYNLVVDANVFTIENLPPGSYSVFAGPVYFMSATRMEVSRGREVVVDMPPIQITEHAKVGLWTFDRKVKLQARDYSVFELCELLTAVTESNPRIIADPSIENEKLRFGKGEMSVWDVLEKLYLDKGWRVVEGKEKTLIIKPAEQTDLPVEGKGTAEAEVERLRENEARRTIAERRRERIEFFGLDITDAPRTTEWADLPDLFEERPPGSKSYEIAKDVTVVYSGLNGTVYYIPDKEIFYIQHDKLGSSTLTYYGPFNGDPHKVLRLETNVSVSSRFRNFHIESRQDLAIHRSA